MQELNYSSSPWSLKEDPGFWKGKHPNVNLDFNPMVSYVEDSDTAYLGFGPIY